jgi:beta-phosphoglucomutase family hydrolase
MTDETRSPEIQGLIFDCDGTLADTMPLHFHAWRSTLDRYGLALDEDRFYSLGGQPTVKIVELLATEQGIELDAEVVAGEKEEAFLSRLQEVQPIAPIVDIVRANAGKLPMAVASGSHRAVVFDVLAIIGLNDLFDENTVVGAEDTELHKPNPDVFLEAARRIGVAPENCRVYEDAELGIEAARRAKMECFDVRDVFTPMRVT